MSFEQHAFNAFILEHNVIGFFEKPVVLKSGRTSCWYVNWRNVASDVYLMDELSQFVISFIKQLVSDKKLSQLPRCLYGVPEGATKLGILCQYKLAKEDSSYAKGSHILSMGRAKPKEHGVANDKYFVGMPEGKTVVLEDTTTTGGSLLSTLDALIEANVEVVAALGLTNRMELRDDRLSVEQAVATKISKNIPVKYFYMSSALELLPKAVEKFKPSKSIIQSIETEFNDFGISPIRF